MRESEPKEELKPIPPFTFNRKHYTSFVFGTFFIWFIFIVVCFSFQFQLIFSVETLREMTGGSIALAGIPFAILSVLSVLGREHDNYLKIALAAVASVFLIIAFGCFLALWTYGDYETPITQSYSF